MTDVEWREIEPDAAYDFIGKPVRVVVDRKSGHLFSTLRTSDTVCFTVDSAAPSSPRCFLWAEASIFYAWYPPTSNITLTDPAEIKRFVEKMDGKGVGKYVR